MSLNQACHGLDITKNTIIIITLICYSVTHNILDTHDSILKLYTLDKTV